MKKAVRCLISLFCTLALLPTLAAPCALADGPQAAAASGFRDSGSLAMDKLSQDEILQLLEAAPLALPDSVFDAAPSCEAPFAAGSVKTSVLQAAADRLNALRRIAGLPQAALDAELCRQAQYGAVLLGASDFSHYPAQPSGMSSEFYRAACAATSSSNIYAGRDLTRAVDGFMDDSDSSNIDRLGHRRWQLNPAMGKVGFGYAVSSAYYGQFVTEKVFDKSGAGCDYDFIAWPASGNFPAVLFSGSTAWSVTLHPGRYAVPDAASIAVTLTREGDGECWSLDSSGSGGYFAVDTSSYGVPNCIIFRPDGVPSYDGVYSVQISGLTTAGGQPVENFSYQVAFFSGEPAEAPTPPAAKPDPQPSGGTAAFRDVPAAHWAYGDIQAAAGLGIVNGYADGSFQPSGQVSNAQFCAMLARALYSGELESAGSGEAWWAPSVLACQGHGLLDGTALGEASSYAWAANHPISRYDMALMAYHVLLDRGSELPSQAGLRQAQLHIRDWDGIPTGYRSAVSACYALGLLTGIDGRFSGGSAMTRAQACAVLCRLMDAA